MKMIIMLEWYEFSTAFCFLVEDVEWINKKTEIGVESLRFSSTFFFFKDFIIRMNKRYKYNRIKFSDNFSL